MFINTFFCCCWSLISVHRGYAKWKCMFGHAVVWLRASNQHRKLNILIRMLYHKSHAGPHYNKNAKWMTGFITRAVLSFQFIELKWNFQHKVLVDSFATKCSNENENESEKQKNYPNAAKYILYIRPLNCCKIAQIFENRFPSQISLDRRTIAAASSCHRTANTDQNIGQTS